MRSHEGATSDAGNRDSLRRGLGVSVGEYVHVYEIPQYSFYKIYTPFETFTLSTMKKTFYDVL